jgi:glycosyltransferase involved in cell wall biosynthesis
VKAAIVTEGLSSGGAERSAAFLAEGFARRGLGVSFVTVNAGETPFYRPPAGCIHVDLGLVRSRMPLVERHLRFHSALYRKLKKTLLGLKPDIVVSMGTKLNVQVIQALKGTGIPVVISERGDPEKGRLEWIYRVLRKTLYPKASTLVCLTSYAAGSYGKRLPGLKAVVIPNPLFPYFEKTATREEPPSTRPARPFILSVGRLSKQKNFSLLLRAFALLAPRYPEWDLVIHGEGKQGPKLMSLAEKLGLDGRVSWPGVTLKLGPVYQGAGLYVQPSLYEGFCNTLLEALAHGKAVVATRWGGVEDLVTDGTNGLLAPMEPQALAAAMDRLLASEEMRKQLGEKARESRELFAPERILDRWMEVLEECCEEK